MATAKRTLIALVEAPPTALPTLPSLFRRRGFNIESISVGHSELPHISRMTIVVNGTAMIVEQVRKQLDRVIDVIKVSDITDDNMVARELALIKVRATSSSRSEIIEIVDIFRANIVDVAPGSVTIEVTGDEKKIDSLLNLVRSFGIKELARTGRVGMTRGGTGLSQLESKTPKTTHKG